jgi:uncharacterized protein (TIGR03000 family)
VYGAIVAAMLTTTAPAAPDWWWQFQGFGCGPFNYPGACNYPWGSYYPGWSYGSYGYYAPWYWYAPYGPWYAYPFPYYPFAANDGAGDREKAAATARVVVKVPEGARLFVDNEPCPLTSAERSFDTPELRPGVTYHYTLRAEVTRDGRTLKESKRVTVTAGRETKVEFGEPRAVEAVRR